LLDESLSFAIELCRKHSTTVGQSQYASGTKAGSSVSSMFERYRESKMAVPLADKIQRGL
jgi:hypothetical protein